MRPVIAIVMGFLILFGLSSITSYKINLTSAKIQEQLTMTESLILSNQWNEALQELDTAQQQWSSARNWWAVVLDHATLSNIEISLQRLEQFIITEEKSHSLAELHTLIILMKEIPESEILKINNIL